MSEHDIIYGTGDVMNERSAVVKTRLGKLAEFRYLQRRFLSFSEAVCGEAGISAQQYQLMQVIAALPEGKAASITYLAERMFLRHNSAVELVDRAVRANMVRRESDEDDLRRSLVRMTEEGEELLDRLVLAHLAYLDTNGGDVMRTMELLLASGRNQIEGDAG
jgi:DNA-binding MarR family transcriptional regulator